MPAGDLVTVDYQLELRAVLMGRGSDVHFDDARGGLGGLFDDPGEAVETPYLHEPGSFIGETHRPARTVTAAMLVVGASEAAVGASVVALRTAWAADAAALEQALWFKWPGFGKRYVLGQPLGLTVMDFTKSLILRRVPVLGSFRITDPTIYT